LLARLTDAQVGQAIEPLLKQIGQAANPEALRTLAQALQALAGKMTEAQAAQASEAAAASLAWAAADGESAEWARALVALAHPPRAGRSARQPAQGGGPFASHLLDTQPGVLDDQVPDERRLGIAAGLA